MSDNTARTLDSLDVAALRKADRIVFRHTRKDGSAIEAIKEAKKTPANPFATDILHIIPTQSYAFDYGDRSNSWGVHLKSDEFSAFEMEHNGDSGFGGIAEFLKAGDVVTLAWLRDGKRSPAVAEGIPGWHCDMLELRVSRKSKQYKFLVDVSICQDNTARMIKR